MLNFNGRVSQASVKNFQITKGMHWVMPFFYCSAKNKGRTVYNISDAYDGGGASFSSTSLSRKHETNSHHSETLVQPSVNQSTFLLSNSKLSVQLNNSSTITITSAGVVIFASVISVVTSPFICLVHNQVKISNM